MKRMWMAQELIRLLSLPSRSRRGLLPRSTATPGACVFAPSTHQTAKLRKAGQARGRLDCIRGYAPSLRRRRLLRGTSRDLSFAGRRRRLKNGGNLASMKAALLSDRGVVKVAGDEARSFLHGLVSADMLELRPIGARFGALLTPQGKIVADFITTEAAAKDGGGFFLDVARERVKTLVDRFNLYKLRSRVMIEDLSDVLGVMAAWDGTGATSIGLAYPDPRLPALGVRIMLPPHRGGDAAASLSATLVGEGKYEAHRIGLGIPRGGADFTYGDAFPHEADMDQLGGVDFAKG